MVFQINLSIDRRVIPGPAWNQIPFRVRSFPDNLAQLSVNPVREPTESEGDMEGMNTQIAHTAIFAVVFDHPLPIDRLFWIEIRRMEQAALDFDDFAEIFFQQRTNDGYSAGIEWQFRRAANKDLRILFDNFHDHPIGRQIDPERLFAEQMFPCPDNVGIKLGVEVMGDGTIDGLHILALEESMVIGRREPEGWDVLFKPAEGALVRIARCDKDRSGIALGEMTPSRCSAGKFPAHKAQPNKSEANFSGHKILEESIEVTGRRF